MAWLLSPKIERDWETAVREYCKDSVAKTVVEAFAPGHPTVGGGHGDTFNRLKEKMPPLELSVGWKTACVPQHITYYKPQKL